MAQPHLAKSRVLSDSKITTELAIKKMNRFKSNATEITDRRVQMKSKQMGERFQCCWAKRKEISGQNAMFVSSGLPNSTHKNQNHMYATWAKGLGQQILYSNRVAKSDPVGFGAPNHWGFASFPIDSSPMQVAILHWLEHGETRETVEWCNPRCKIMIFTTLQKPIGNYNRLTKVNSNEK